MAITYVGDVPTDRLYIDGAWVTPAADDQIPLISPVTEQQIGRSAAAGRTDIDLAVRAARRAFDSGPWPRTPPGERAALLRQVAYRYAVEADRMTRLIVDEMGSPISWARQHQVPDPLGILRFYADLADRYSWEQTRADDTGTALLLREPVGVVAAVVPWNMPQKTIMMKLAPALAAGCAVVIKPAPETPLDALLLAQILHEAGLPPGVVNVVPARPDVAEALVMHPGVDKVAFTGSTRAGKRIASLCGLDLRRVTLELGGKSPAVVCGDADLDAFLAATPGASLANSGQICSAHTRILAHRAVYDRVVEGLADLMEDLQVGDPLDPATQVGPLVTARQRSRVHDYIQVGQAEGATLVTGGTTSPPTRAGHRLGGWYVTPTLFADVDNRSRIAQEEIFGPVLTVTPFDTEEEAIRLANDSRYGLDGGVWAGDPARAHTLARKIRAGTVQVNGAPPGLLTPLGGYRESGIGRELGLEGLEHYTELKAISVPTG